MTPGKAYLQRKIKARSSSGGGSRAKDGASDVKRTFSHDSLANGQQTLGVPAEPGREFDELVDEVVEEVRRRRGGQTPADGLELRKMVEESLSRNLSDSGQAKGKSL